MYVMQYCLFRAKNTDWLPKMTELPTSISMFNNNILRLATLAIFLIAGCAKQGSLVGGAKDTTPPGLDSLRSTPNFRTNFNAQKIELTFDEWVQLKDVPKEVLISPPMDKRPTITLKKKTVIVDFGENPAFRPNTTYTINFGGAVRDLHESNPAKDLRYVFATGPAIDSCTLDGVVSDAQTGALLENMTVLLYDQFYDSVALREKPYYFAKTDKSGVFSIKNVKTGRFKVMAIDEGQAPDLKWNPGVERVAFSDSAVVLSDSLQRALVLLSVFKNAGIAKTTDKNANNYGVVRIAWTDLAPDDQRIVLGQKALEAGMRYKIENNKDTTLVWYDFPNDTTTIPWSLTVQDTSVKVAIKSFKRNDFALRHRLRPVDEGGAAPANTGRSSRGGGARAAPPTPATQLPPKNVSILPGKTGKLRFNFPISATDTSKWMARLDSVRFTAFTLAPDSAQSRHLQLNGNWKAGNAIAITVLPGGITDFYGLANVDTIVYNVNILTDKQLGSLNLVVEKTKPGTAYVLELLNGTVKETERSFIATESSTKLKFADLQAATYTVNLIEDTNANGRWDTGNYFEHRQPELIFNKKLEPLRAKWELEAKMVAEKDTGKRK